MTAGRYPTVVETPARQAERDAAATVLAGLALTCAVVVVLTAVYAASAETVVVAVVLGTAPAMLTAVAVLRRRPLTTTVADRVTLARAVLASGCAAVTVLVLAGAVPDRSWWLLALVVPCLLLDSADGHVARRTGTVSAAGARLDGELDAGILVVLSLAVTPVLGAWVLLIGAMRYLFLVGSWVRPAWRGALAHSDVRRAVAGLQGVALAVAVAPVVPPGVASAGVAIALLLLAVSFARDVATLESRARVKLGAR
jgi:phosphatidylglycerophosphate synthase